MTPIAIIETGLGCRHSGYGVRETSEQSQGSWLITLERPSASYLVLATPRVADRAGQSMATWHRLSDTQFIIRATNAADIISISVVVFDLAVKKDTP